tara:strand:- start:157 stop:303 length:147 start_codon:yes stop_codon:yes gene_type:complete
MYPDKIQEKNDRLVNFRVSKSVEIKLKQLNNASEWLRSLIEKHQEELG